MILKRAPLTLLFAAIGLAAGIAPSLAAPAFATANVNVRSGPGTNFSVVDQLRPGEAVDIDHCQGSWCFVHKPGPNGWVSANYLSRGDYVPPGYDPIPVPPPVYIRPPRYAPPPVYIPPAPPMPHWHSWRGYPDWDEPYWPHRWSQPSSVCLGGPMGSLCVTD